MIETEKQNGINTKENRRVVLSAALLALSLVLLCAAVYAWYVGNKNVSTSGFELSADNGDITIADIFVISRGTEAGVYSSYHYKKDADKSFYLFDIATDEWVYDGEGKKISVDIGGLLPGEYLEFEMSFARGGNLEGVGLTYDIAMLGIRGDTFTNLEGTKTYTILGVYRINMLDADGNLLDKDGRIIYTDGVPYEGYDVVESNIWLDFYDDELEPAYQQTLRGGLDWDASTAVQTVKFRMTLDLTQLAALELTNVLSEKSFSVSGVRLIITDIDN